MAQSRTKKPSKKLGKGKGGQLGAGKLGGGKLGGGKPAGKLGAPNKDVLTLKPNDPSEQTLAELAAAIRALQVEDGGESVDARVEIGQRLREAQGMLERGGWQKFLSEEVNYARRTAYRLMQLGVWARSNRQVLSRVRDWGPTKVYEVMDAGPALAKRLLSRKRHAVVGSGALKAPQRMTVGELRGVLGMMRGGRGGAKRTASEAAAAEAEEALRKLERASEKAMKWTNRLAAAGAVDAERLAAVRRRLLRCERKLEKKAMELI